MFKEKIGLFKQKCGLIFGKDTSGEMDFENSRAILRKQIIRAACVGLSLLLILWLLTEAVSNAGQSIENGNNKEQQDLTKSNIDLADKALDTEVFWRNYFEDDMTKQKTTTKLMIDELKESQEQLLRDVKISLAEAVDRVHVVSSQQKSEFENATNQLKQSLEEQRLLTEAAEQQVRSIQIEEMGFENDIVFDDPKSAEDYIPEGTFFSGFLLGGVVVSTALNTPDENSTPVTIRLKGRGNLDSENQLNISECRMTGSAYGDLSSERAVIRLEKMICKESGVYITSDIAGIVYGPDGYNGIKGTVVSTSSKHLKNAAIGGLLSGLSSAAKGQEGFTIGAGGIASSKSKGMGDLLKSGGMSGVSNVGEKVADYYLKQAESMSPVLTIEAGVKVNTQITKGFFFGERGMRSKLKQERKSVEKKEVRK